MRRTVIVKLGDTFANLADALGDFEDWISRRLGDPAAEIATVDARTSSNLPRPGELAAVVLSGSHSMVTDREPWSERVAAWIPEVVEANVPLLGICYGHQLLAHALGGEVGANPHGCEFGTVEISVHDTAARDPLFADVPRTFPAHVSHYQSVLRLPAGATCLASSRRDPHHAFVVGRRAWGVQFHPEFNAEVAAAYIRESSPNLRKAGLDPAKLLQTVTETPTSEALLARFAAAAKTHA